MVRWSPAREDIAGRVARSLSVADAALRGELDAERVRAVDPEDAMAAVRELPGSGPFSSALIVIRGAGAADAPATSEPRPRRAWAAFALRLLRLLG